MAINAVSFFSTHQADCDTFYDQVAADTTTSVFLDVMKTDLRGNACATGRDRRCQLTAAAAGEPRMS